MESEDTKMFLEFMVSANKTIEAMLETLEIHTKLIEKLNAEIDHLQIYGAN